MTEPFTTLIEAACEARRRSYAPYSGFSVGAALLCADGRIITAANVENASFGLSICAERAAVSRAIAEGMRDFEAIAICADGTHPTPPCGACRQVLLEFAPRLVVVMAGTRGAAGEVIHATLDVLLPRAFSDFPGRRHDGVESETP